MRTVHCGHANSPGPPVTSRRAFIVAGGRRGNKVIIGRKLSDRPEKKKKKALLSVRSSGISKRTTLHQPQNKNKTSNMSNGGPANFPQGPSASRATSDSTYSGSEKEWAIKRN